MNKTILMFNLLRQGATMLRSATWRKTPTMVTIAAIGVFLSAFLTCLTPELQQEQGGTVNIPDVLQDFLRPEVTDGTAA